MTRAIPTPCQHTGCGMLVRGGGYCAEHNVWRKRREQPRQERERGSPSERGYGADWRRLRTMILARQPLCRECGAPATEVDHIVPRARGGSDAATNLQPLCHRCHSAKTLRDADGRKAVEIIVITGAPRAGKSTHAESIMRAGDALWDWDAVLSAVCPAGCDERPMRAAMRALRAATLAAPWPGRLVVIVTDPEQALEMAGAHGARLVVVDPGIDRAMEQAERRAIERGRDPAAARQRVSGWYAQAAALGPRLPRPLGVGGCAPLGVPRSTGGGGPFLHAQELSPPQPRGATARG